jgi:hypothetical protein
VYCTAIGQRSINAVGRGYLFEPESRYVVEIIYNPNDAGIIGNLFSSKKVMVDEISGAIYKVKPDVIKGLLDAHKFNSTTRKKFMIDPNKDVEEYISKLEGIWHSKCCFDGTVYWDSSRSCDWPYYIDYEPACLPSDSIFRMDCIYLIMNDLNKA